MSIASTGSCDLLYQIQLYFAVFQINPVCDCDLIILEALRRSVGVSVVTCPHFQAKVRVDSNSSHTP